MSEQKVTLKDIYDAIKVLRDEVNSNFVRKEVFAAETKRLEDLIQQGNLNVADVRGELRGLIKRVIAVASSISALLAAIAAVLVEQLIR